MKTAVKKLVVTLSAIGMLAAAGMAHAGQYIILYKKNAIPSNVEKEITSAGGTLIRMIPQVGIAVASSDDANFLSKARSMKGVAGADPDVALGVPETTGQAVENAPTSDDTFFNSGLVWGVERVGAPEAWTMGYTGSHDTVVAIIDTGIASNHPDLAPNLIYNDCYTSAGSYAEGNCNPYPAYSDHGTHVAGTVAAAFGGGGVVGVAPNMGLANYNTFEVIPDCGVCSYSSSRWAAMLDAAERDFDVISMSLGSTGQYGGQGSNDMAAFVAAEKRVASEVLKMGTALVASAGNSGLDLNGTIIHLPGDIPGIINTAATGIQPFARYQEGSFDIPAFYTNYGAAITLTAPGGDCGQVGVCDGNRPANWFEYLVLSTIVAPSPACAATESCPVGYGWKGGTSMATPHVSAAVGLVKDVNPDLSPMKAQNIIKSTADNIGSRQYFGHGMLNVVSAIEKAKE